MQVRDEKSPGINSTWKNFYAYYENRLASYKQSSLAKHEATRAYPQESKLSDDEAARIIQRRWRFLRENSILVNVKLGKKHSAHLHYFLNQANVKKLLHKGKLEALEYALLHGDWSASIFSDPDLAYLAMSLCLAEKISETQLFTILDYVPITKEMKLQRVFPILDEKDQFTEEAIDRLIFKLEKIPGDRFEEARIEKFRLLVAGLPKSERIFYITGLGKLGERLSTLDKSIIHNCVIHPDFESKTIMHLPYGVLNAIGLTRFGENQYTPPFPRLSVQTREDVEYGVRHHVRVAVTQYPRTERYSQIHNRKNVSHAIAARHDTYHADVLSSMPEPFRKVFLRFVDVARAAFKFPWTLEEWRWIDGEYLYLLAYPELRNLEKLTLSASTERFCMMLTSRFFGCEPGGKDCSGHLLNEYSPTAVGAAILIDMFENKEAWMALKISPDFLMEPFATYYQWIAKNSKKSDAVQIKVAKCLSYFELEHTENSKYFPFLCETIDQNPEKFLQDFTFIKSAVGDNTKNKVVFRMGHSEVRGDSLVRYVETHYKDKNYFEARLHFDYSEPQARQYAVLRESGLAKYESQHQIKPSFTSWFMKDWTFLKALLIPTVVVPLIAVAFAKYSVWKKSRIETRKGPSLLRSSTNNAKLHKQFGVESKGVELSLVVKPVVGKIDFSYSKLVPKPQVALVERTRDYSLKR